MSRRSLPVLQPASSLGVDGKRNWVHPADVEGRFTGARRAVFALLTLILIVIPFLRIDGRPAIFLDIAHRQFFLFGASFNAQDAWLLFFVVTGLGFSIFVITTLLGRVWCGYACPQTVFLEGAYRRIERLIEGPRNERIRRDKGPFNIDKAWRKILKHTLFIVLSLLISHAFLSYFVSMPALFQMVRSSPAEHMEAFGWMAAVTAILYGNFAFFREQLCLVVCPYGRLQSVLTDKDTLVVGYDVARGEPRGKAKDPSAGDCVDCGRCVAVCPTGIDIRNGLQIECVGCAACIDACDEIMEKLKKPRGLVRYDSQRGLDGEGKRFYRPRLLLYLFFGLVGLVAASIVFRSRTSFEANLLRLQGAPFTVTDEGVRNGYDLHLINKRDEEVTYLVELEEREGLSAVIPQARVELGPLAQRHAPLFVTAARGADPPTSIVLRVTPEGAPEEERRIEAPFLAPAGGARPR